MKKKIEKLFVCLLGAMAGIVQIYGWNPIGFGYYCGTVSCGINTFIMLLCVLTGIYLSSSYIDVFRYGIGMLLFSIIYNISNEKQQKNVVFTGIITGVSLFVMNITKYLLVSNDKTQLILGILESILSAAVSVVVACFVEKLFYKPKKTKSVSKAAGEARLNESAQMLNRLSNSFEHLPVKKDVLNSQDIHDMYDELINKFCKDCDSYDKCWNKFYETTCEGAYDMFRQLDKNKGVSESAASLELSRSCPHFPMLMNQAGQIFEKTKNNFLWYNRLIENRQAVALQLNEVARMMQEASEEISSQREVDEKLADEIKRKLKLHHISTHSVIERKGKCGRIEYVLKMNAVKGKCISVRDIAGYLSDVLGKSYTADKESRLVLNQNEEEILFVEEPNYKVVHACARTAKAGERVLGDNFSFCHSNGQMAACLSDGMGSGIVASQSSELVIELFENFIEAGFCKETALRMMNSMLIMNSQNGKYSTIDVAEVDLYAGVCEFVKMGGAVSFIKRENCVEAVNLESLPVGSFFDQGFESAIKPLYDGDYVIMISDGVLAPLPKAMTEQVMAQLISKIDSYNPKEMANQILESVLKECDYTPMDDMTVLVFGMIKN